MTEKQLIDGLIEIAEEIEISCRPGITYQDLHDIMDRAYEKVKALAYYGGLDIHSDHKPIQ